MPERGVPRYATLYGMFEDSSFADLNVCHCFQISVRETEIVNVGNAVTSAK